MTDKEMKATKAKLSCGWENGKYKQGTPEDEHTSEELACRDMLNSILCYAYGHKTTTDNQYLARYVADLGYETVDRLRKEQEDDIAKSRVKTGVYTDSDGLEYSAIIWYDEDPLKGGKQDESAN